MPDTHKGHNVIATETGRISFVAGDITDTRKEILFCTDCMVAVQEDPQTAQAVDDLDEFPF